MQWNYKNEKCKDFLIIFDILRSRQKNIQEAQEQDKDWCSPGGK